MAEIRSVEIIYRDKERGSFIIGNTFDYIYYVSYNPFTKNYTIKTLLERMIIPKREVAQINIVYVNDISEEEMNDDSEDD